MPSPDRPNRRKPSHPARRARRIVGATSAAGLALATGALALSGAHAVDTATVASPTAADASFTDATSSPTTASTSAPSTTTTTAKASTTTTTAKATTTTTAKAATPSTTAQTSSHSS